MSNAMTRRPHVASLLAAALAISVLAGCATQPRSGDYYRRGEALREQTVRMAVVESVRDVTMDRQSHGVGTLTGAAIGGVAGSAIGQGRGSAIATIGGTVLGGAIGQAIEDRTARVPALEITVRLADGTLTAVVQEAGAVRPRPGDTVRLLTGRGVTRVAPA